MIYGAGSAAGVTTGCLADVPMYIQLQQVVRHSDADKRGVTHGARTS
ncbi:MAG: hypothetical protein ACLFV2_11770 [Desulfurivibrionaceae bacterium]